MTTISDAATIQWLREKADEHRAEFGTANITGAYFDHAADVIQRLKNALTRLGSMEAFDIATADVPEELKRRIDFARAANGN